MDKISSMRFRELSKEEKKKRDAENKNILEKRIQKEYENFKRYIGFFQLPVISKIEIVRNGKIDARVRPDFVPTRGYEIQVNKKFLKKEYNDFLSVVLFHEFTHIWDRTCNEWWLRALQITEYHAVQVAFGKNLGLQSVDEWTTFSENQYIWNEKEKVKISSYLKQLFEDYYYRMKYSFYRNYEGNIESYMYDLCQRVGYSVVCSKYCREWNGKDEYEVFIPEELTEEYEQLYIVA